jgi:hypothetical protein
MIAVNDNVDILSLQGSQLAPHVLNRLGVAWIDPFENVLTRYEKSLDVFHLRKPNLNLFDFVIFVPFLDLDMQSTPFRSLNLLHPFSKLLGHCRTTLGLGLAGGTQ